MDILSLPKEILALVFQYLSFEDGAKQLALTNTKFYNYLCLCQLTIFFIILKIPCPPGDPNF